MQCDVCELDQPAVTRDDDGFRCCDPCAQATG